MRAGLDCSQSVWTWQDASTSLRYITWDFFMAWCRNVSSLHTSIGSFIGFWFLCIPNFDLLSFQWKDISSDRKSQQVQPSSTQLGQDRYQEPRLHQHVLNNMCLTLLCLQQHQTCERVGQATLHQWVWRSHSETSERVSHHVLGLRGELLPSAPRQTFHQCLKIDHQELRARLGCKRTEVLFAGICDVRASSQRNTSCFLRGKYYFLSIQAVWWRPYLSADSFSQERCSASRADRSHTLCWFLEEENQRSTELLQRLDAHIHHMKGNTWKTQSKQPPNVLGPAWPSENSLAQ